MHQMAAFGILAQLEGAWLWSSVSGAEGWGGELRVCFDCVCCSRADFDILVQHDGLAALDLRFP